MDTAYIVTTGGVTAARGFRAAAAACGLKKQGMDLALLASDAMAACAGVFTTNVVKAAPVLWTQQVAAGGRAQAVVLNSGNANACNGPQGEAAARRMAELAGDGIGVPAELVAVASTGVIGKPLDMAKVSAGIATVTAALAPTGGSAAAQAIMTTDTRPKEFAVTVNLSGGPVQIGGMAKGSGMIHPNMATMLCFLTSDAAVESRLLQQMLRRAANISFNMVTVDGDTSTNDMVFILANGAAGVAVATPEDIAAFQVGLNAVCTELAKMIARDGEGAGKLIEVRVEGAGDENAARAVARSIASSNLVKTAIHGEDANWGRIFCAAGYAGVPFAPDRVDIFIGDLPVAAAGVALPFDEELARTILQGREVLIRVDLQAGAAAATAWTCDLTCDYIKINASYRT